MSTTSDDLDAVRTIAGALEPFNSADRVRILRWVQEKLGMIEGATQLSAGAPAPALSTHGEPAPTSAVSGASQDIRTFLAAKAPTNFHHVVAAVAYYHRFEAPTKRDTIGKDEVLEACRQAQIKRPAAVGQALINAAAAGFVDRADRGQYRLNAVGENLVAMVLPEQGPTKSMSGSQGKPRKSTATKPNGKKRK